MTTLAEYIGNDAITADYYTRTADGMLNRTGYSQDITAEQADGFDTEELLQGWPNHRVFWSSPTGCAVGWAPRRAS